MVEWLKYLEYIKEEGRFKWKVKIRNTEIGQYAGNQRNAIYVTENDIKYLVTEAQLVWFCENGDFTPLLSSGKRMQLFHKDGNKLNNHIDNLCLYRDPTGTESLKRCTHCNEYKDRGKDFSGKYPSNCKGCCSRKVLLKRKEDKIKFQEIRKNDAERHRIAREYNHFMKQMEASE